MSAPRRRDSGAARARPPLRHGDAPIRVGISTCLLGEPVRWDGGHERDRFLTDGLGRYVEWVPVCPEVELGMGTPREPVHLASRGGEVRMLGARSATDWTDRMRAWSQRRAGQLAREELSGFVLKQDSPSCGLERVELKSEQGMRRRRGRGIFAEALRRRHPELPVEEEGRLRDLALRENFIERIFAHRRLRSLFRGRPGLGRLAAFHTAHELALLAHSPEACRALGRLVASAGQLSPAALRERYQADFMRALARPATRRRHVNVLRRCLGCFGERLERASRAELAALIEDYGAELVPLVVPIALIRHHVRRLGVEYLAGQLYLEPHPKELMLRNHA